MSRLRKWTKRALFVGLAAGVVLIASAFPGGGAASPLMATAPSMGSARSFAVLGGSTVTNTGATTITGDLGVSPGSAVTGFPPGIVTGGGTYKADAVALQAQNDVITAYNNLAGQAVTLDLTGQDLGGKTLTPGVYSFSSSAQLTGTLTLNAVGDGSAVFVFKMGSTLTTASNSSVSVINGGSACNVFWQVGSSATLGTGTKFAGSILALTSITLNTGADVSGRALARNGAVTLDTNNVSSAQCAPPATAVPPAATAVPPTATAVPPTATAVPPTATATVVPPAATATAVHPVPSTTPTSAATSETTSAQTVAPTTAPPAETGGVEAPILVELPAEVVVPAPVPATTPLALPNAGDAGSPSYGWWLVAGLILLMAGLLFRRAGRRL